MRTTTLASPVESNLHDFESRTFSIDVTSQSFKVLLDTLYTDKPMAITRELWRNAYDSHVQAGIQDEPFLCSLPSILSSTFTVRDFGVSMTHQEVMELYTTVFRSSKEQTNSMVGMLGLGSKSPFCYTASFTVRAFLDGECRVYVAAIDETGIPTITHVQTSITDERNGIEVSVPIQAKDFRAFESAASKIAFGFDVPPIVDGMDIHETHKAMYADGNWRLFPANTTGLGVRQGCVIYPVDRNLVTNSYRLWNNCGVIIDVPVGSVEPAARSPT